MLMIIIVVPGIMLFFDVIFHVSPVANNVITGMLEGKVCSFAFEYRLIKGSLLNLAIFLFHHF